MYYYQILPEKKLPIDVLTYKSENEYIPGQIVTINIRNSEVFGVILAINEVLEGDLDNIKAISGVFPYIISEKQLLFIKNMANNTFNSPNVIFESIVQPLKIINQKNIKNLSESIYRGQNKIISINNQRNYINSEERQPNLEFILDSRVLVRIRDIIRISILGYLKTSYNTNEKDINILVIFPEKKILDIFFQNTNISTLLDIKSEDFNINLYKYKAERRKSDQDTIISIIKSSPYFDYTNQDTKRNINIYITTKTGIFLPFYSLDKIILCDESNSFYIQEQNSLYYDTRDSVFLFSKSYLADLHFVSSLPSIRLSNFYSEKVLNEISSNYNQKGQKLPKIKIYEKNYINDQYRVISDQILRILHNDEDINEVFSDI